jgi:hypothetical protein
MCQNLNTWSSLNLSKSESYLRLHTWKLDPRKGQDILASAKGPDRFWSIPGLHIVVRLNGSAFRNFPCSNIGWWLSLVPPTRMLCKSERLTFPFTVHGRPPSNRPSPWRVQATSFVLKASTLHHVHCCVKLHSFQYEGCQFNFSFRYYVFARFIWVWNLACNTEGRT